MGWFDPSREEQRLALTVQLMWYLLVTGVVLVPKDVYQVYIRTAAIMGLLCMGWYGFMALRRCCGRRYRGIKVFVQFDTPAFDRYGPFFYLLTFLSLMLAKLLGAAEYWVGVGLLGIGFVWAVYVLADTWRPPNSSHQTLAMEEASS